MTHAGRPRSRHHYICAEVFEEIVEKVIGWNIDFRQLGHSPSPFGIYQFLAPDFLYSRAEFDCRFHQLGGPSLGYRTFALAGNGSSVFSWCGKRIDNDSLIVFPETGDFEAVSVAGFRNHTLSLSEPLLRSTAETRFGQPIENLLPGGRAVFHHCGGSLLRLRQRLEQLAAGIRAGVNQEGTSDCKSLARELAFLVLDSLDTHRRPRCEHQPSRRSRALRAALQHIAGHRDGALDAASLASSCGVSRRTLEYAFRDSIGVSPSAYLKALALRELNADLFRARAKEHRISELASRRGFHHAGQLARDYFDMFGELPRDTLRR